MAREIIKLDRVCKFYRMGESRVDALRELSLTIHENDYMAIFGPSGSGKSTLLHIAGLLDHPLSALIPVRVLSFLLLDGPEKASHVQVSFENLA